MASIERVLQITRCLLIAHQIRVRLAGQVCGLGRGPRRRACAAICCSRPAGSLCGMSFICTWIVLVDSLGTGRLLDYHSVAVVGLSAGFVLRIGPQGTARDGVCMHTGTAGSSLLLTLVWIVFTEVSSSRSGSGLATGVWCSGIIFTASPGSRAPAGTEKRSDSYCARVVLTCYWL